MSRKPASAPQVRKPVKRVVRKPAEPLAVRTNAQAPRDAHPLSMHLPVQVNHFIHATHQESGEIHRVQLKRYRQMVGDEYVEILCYPQGYTAHPNCEPSATDQSLRNQVMGIAARTVQPASTALAPAGEPRTTEEMAAYLRSHPPVRVTGKPLAKLFPKPAAKPAGKDGGKGK